MIDLFRLHFVKENRKYGTEAEVILWKYIRNRQLGVNFRRQHIIGDYIADFVCLSSKLIIELDGKYHQLPDQQISDEVRTRWLESKGFKVIRFTNEEIAGNIKEVINHIRDYINERK